MSRIHKICYKKKIVISLLSKLLGGLNKKAYIITSAIITIFIFFLASLVINILFNNIEDIEYLRDLNIYLIFFLTVIIVPFIETFVFQKVIIEFIINRFPQYNLYFSIIISALIFASFHCYSTAYFIGIMFIGLNFSFFYILSMKRKDVSPFLHVTFLHMLMNFISFLLNDVFQK
ncbi:CPBP family intramembrane glutamic endopeptidase [Flavobacterium hiemivividum]|uniref:CPBP family intramembrane metalloprotease n=1 Tax=Flavobacterium hiemivividum TaxID=2541734 RepID=A0A4R5CNG7_9FLAO|nr:CPBP family intramembrane metalloprotease [Flavobacterium hiemivividum]